MLDFDYVPDVSHSPDMLLNDITFQPKPVSNQHGQYHATNFFLDKFLKKMMKGKDVKEEKVIPVDLNDSLRIPEAPLFSKGGTQRWVGKTQEYMIKARQAMQLAKKMNQVSSSYATEAFKMKDIAYRAELAQTAQAEQYGMLHSRTINQMRELCNRTKAVLGQNAFVRVFDEASKQDVIVSNYRLWNRRSMLELRYKCAKLDDYFNTKMNIKLPTDELDKEAEEWLHGVKFEDMPKEEINNIHQLLAHFPEGNLTSQQQQQVLDAAFPLATQSPKPKVDKGTALDMIRDSFPTGLESSGLNPSKRYIIPRDKMSALQKQA